MLKGSPDVYLSGPIRKYIENKGGRYDAENITHAILVYIEKRFVTSYLLFSYYCLYLYKISS